MIRALFVRNLTVFPDAYFQFGQGLNVITGDNGTGKTHLLKFLYSTLSSLYTARNSSFHKVPTKAAFGPYLSSKLFGMFGSEIIGHLVRRAKGVGRCDAVMNFVEFDCNYSLYISNVKKTEVVIDNLPLAWPRKEGAFVYISAHEPISNTQQTILVDTFHNTSGKQPGRDNLFAISEKLEDIAGGKIEWDPVDGCFFFRDRNISSKHGRLDTSLAAGGSHIFAELARLIKDGAIPNSGCIFWDCPETGLSVSNIRKVAQVLVDLGDVGVQVFVVTHSLYLLGEIETFMSKARGPSMYLFELKRTEDGVIVQQKPDLLIER